MEPTGCALLAGDASVVSGFREIHVPWVWHVYSASGFDFREKNRAVLGLIRAAMLSSASYLAIILCRKDEADYFSRNFVCLLRTTTTRYMVSFIDFYFHFLANFQWPKLCPICSLHLLNVMKPVRDTNSEPGLPMMRTAKKQQWNNNFAILCTMPFCKFLSLHCMSVTWNFPIPWVRFME